MGTHVIRMPDIGEGIAEVELVEWRVKPGDAVQEDQILADVMTDKATVEIPSPVTGTVVASVKKTGRCVIVHEATRTSGFGAELSALVQEHCFYELEAPIERVAGWDTPYPHAQEWAYFPGPDRVGAALKRVMEG